MNEILNMKDVFFYYDTKAGKTVILENLNYSFETGKMYAIMGPSGSGKTTALSILGALKRPQKGCVEFNGIDVREIGYEKYRRENIAIVFQAYNLFEYLTAVGNVEVVSEISRKDKCKKEQAKDLLRRLGITDEKFNKKPGELSGGEQQRIAIARALMSDGEIILADEPTGNLDAEISKEISKLFVNIAHDMNKCVIIVTHSMELAAMADEIVVIKEKRFFSDRRN